MVLSIIKYHNITAIHQSINNKSYYAVIYYLLESKNIANELNMFFFFFVVVAASGHFINNPFDKISFNKTNDFIHNIEQKFHDISITNILSSSKCLIPSNANNIVRAALIQQCVSPSLGKL